MSCPHKERHQHYSSIQDDLYNQSQILLEDITSQESRLVDLDRFLENYKVCPRETCRIPYWLFVVLEKLLEDVTDSKNQSRSKFNKVEELIKRNQNKIRTNQTRAQICGCYNVFEFT